jgi:transposase
MGQVAVFSGPIRRRHWTDEQRLQILGEAFAPGGCVSRTARQYDVSTGQLYTWRQKLHPPHSAPRFAEAIVGEDDPALSPSMSPAVVIDLSRGKRVSIFASASPALAAAILKALR